MQENFINEIKNKTYDSVDINNDYILPDYIDDAEKLVRCDTKVIVHNIYSNDSFDSYEGEVVYSILVICQDNTIRSIVYSEDFSVNCNTDGKKTAYEYKLEHAGARLLSKRKVNCRAKITFSVKSTTQRSVQPIIMAEGIEAPDSTIEKRGEICEYTVEHSDYIKGRHASRDIEISADREELASIVYCDTNIYINEQKLTEGKLYLKGEYNTVILYETVNSDYRRLCEHYPFNEIIDCGFEADGYICTADVTDIKAQVQNNSFGEMRIIELDYIYNLKLKGYKNHSTKIYNDIYSTKYNCKLYDEQINIYKTDRVFSTAINVTDSKSIQDISDEDIAEISDCNATILSSQIDYDKEKGKLIVSGEIKLDLICRGRDDIEKRYYHTSHIKSFKSEYDHSPSTGQLYSEHNLKITDCKAAIEKSRISIALVLYLSIMVGESNSISYISKAELTTERENKHSVIIYYPKSDDLLWNIAKEYGASLEAVKKANNLTADSIEDRRVILLPKKQ